MCVLDSCAVVVNQGSNYPLSTIAPFMDPYNPSIYYVLLRNSNRAELDRHRKIENIDYVTLSRYGVCCKQVNSALVKLIGPIWLLGY